MKLYACKCEGKWYWRSHKESWNRIYYTFDGGDSWHRTKREAFEVAKLASKLSPLRDAEEIARCERDLAERKARKEAMLNRRACEAIEAIPGRDEAASGW